MTFVQREADVHFPEIVSFYEQLHAQLPADLLVRHIGDVYSPGGFVAVGLKGSHCPQVLGAQALHVLGAPGKDPPLLVHVGAEGVVLPLVGVYWYHIHVRVQDDGRELGPGSGPLHNEHRLGRTLNVDWQGQPVSLVLKELDTFS